MLHKDVEKVLISESELAETVKRLADQISADYSASDSRLVLLCILKGSIVFMGDLMKQLSIPVEIDCMKVSSYGNGTVSGGNINILLDFVRPDMDKCDVLIVEDIIDSGRDRKSVV